MKSHSNLLAAFGIIASAISAQGAIIAYNEIGGAHVAGWGSTGNLVGGAFDGMNISSISGAQFFGAENNTFRIVDASGLDHHYLITPGAGGNNAYFGNGAGTVLTGGGVLNGQSLKNGNWLGATNDVNYYTDGTGGVIRYFDGLNHPLHFDAPWTSFTNGELNGQSVTVGSGLVDFGGGNAMNENLYVTIDTSGTMEYYNLDNGFYSPGESEGGYGTWTTFSGGELDGLTLSYLQANPVGTINGTTYRFLGTSEEGMYFDIGSVPEPSTALLSGLVAFGLLKRRRK